MTEPKKKDKKVAEALIDSKNRIRKLEDQIDELQKKALAFKKRFDLIQLAGLLGTWEYDIENQVMHIDDSLRKVFGYTQKDLDSARQNWTDYIHPDDLQGLLQSVVDNFKGKTKHFEYTHRLRKKDGTYRWVVARGTSLKDENGRAYRLLGLDVDISKYKIMEVDLKQRFELERIISEVSTDFINLSPDMLDNGLNDALAKIGQISAVDRCYIFQFFEQGKKMNNTHEWCATGIKSEKKNSQNISIEQFPLYGRQVQNFKTVHIKDVSKLPKKVKKEKERWTRQGIKSILVVPMVFAGEVAGFIGFEAVRSRKEWIEEDIRFLKVLAEIFVNAIKRIESDRLLLENEKQYRTLFELSPSGIMLENIKGYILDANPSYCQSLGYKREELIGKNVDMLAQPSALKEISKNISALIDGGELLHVVKSFRKDGSFCYMELSEKGITLPDGSRGILCIANDISNRVEAENALKESEERYRNLVENTPNGVIVHQEGDLVFANRASVQIMGARSVGEVLGIPVIDFIHPDFTDVVKTRIKNILQGKPVKNPIEEKYIRVDGQIIDVEATAIRISFNEKPASLVVFREITDRKKMEDALRQSEDHFRGLFENSPISIWEKDFSSLLTELKKINHKKGNNNALSDLSLGEKLVKKIRIVEVNRATISLLEAGTKANLFSNYLKIFNNDTHETMARAAKALFAGKNKYSGETSAQTLKGNLIYLTINLFIAPGQSENWNRVILSINNITDLIKAEKAARENEIRFRSIFENALIGIYQTTPEGKILTANKTMVNMLGYRSFKEIEKLAISNESFGEGYTREQFKERIEKEGIIVGLESAWKKKSGEMLYIRESARAIKDENGKTLYYEGTVEDITEKKQLEKLLQQAQKIEAVGQLAGGIAHDFNNLLTIISGHAELALMKLSGENPQLRDLKAIQSAAERAGKLTRKLLGFSRKQMLELHVLDMNSVIEEHLEMIRSLIGENIFIAIDLKADNPLVLADPNQIEQILLNLSINARDAINEKNAKGENRITIKTSNIDIHEDMATIHPLNESGPHIVISISDTGIGISEDMKDKIFDPFYTTKSLEKGTGLGLASVYGIVRQNNAGIYVYSDEGLGTTFKIVWPTHSTDEPASKFSRPKREIDRGKGNILFVEDEQGVRDFACSALRLMGYEVVEAENGVRALELLAHPEKPFDLVITDLIMPEMGGVELAEAIYHRYPEIQILYTSGYSDDHVLFENRNQENIDFLHKPYSINDLGERIKDILNRK